MESLSPETPFKHLSEYNSVLNGVAEVLFSHWSRRISAFSCHYELLMFSAVQACVKQSITVTIGALQ